MEMRKSHFVLVHGGCHGAWCWYKLATMLRSAGYRVSAPDMAASGINMKPLEELKSASEYTQPLMDCLSSLPSTEKVILVGHSFGGISISLAMERFPDKIAVAVFVTAFMPGPDTAFTTLLHEYYSRLDSQLDNKFFFANGVDNPPTSFVFGEEFQASILYQNCPPEVRVIMRSLDDSVIYTFCLRRGSIHVIQVLTLAKMLIKPLFLLTDSNLTEDIVLSKEKYGSVRRVYVEIDEDRVLKKDFQEQMIKNNPVEEVKEIVGADHMVMLSKPQELCACLCNISASYC